MTDYAKNLDSIAAWIIAEKRTEDNLTTALMGVARDLLKERDTAQLLVYRLHAKHMSDARLSGTCDCEICESAMFLIEKANAH